MRIETVNNCCKALHFYNFYPAPTQKELYSKLLAIQEKRDVPRADYRRNYGTIRIIHAYVTSEQKRAITNLQAVGFEIALATPASDPKETLYLMVLDLSKLVKPRSVK